MGKAYRIKAVFKVETDIITSIASRLIGRFEILVIMYFETFKTDVISFISNVNVIMCLMSHWPIIVSIRIRSLILTISLCEVKMSKLPVKKWGHCVNCNPRLSDSSLLIHRITSPFQKKNPHNIKSDISKNIFHNKTRGNLVQSF